MTSRFPPRRDAGKVARGKRCAYPWLPSPSLRGGNREDGRGARDQIADSSNSCRSRPESRRVSMSEQERGGANGGGAARQANGTRRRAERVPEETAGVDYRFPASRKVYVNGTLHT